jgi:hypothetical protein
MGLEGAGKTHMLYNYLVGEGGIILNIIYIVGMHTIK